MNRPTAYVGIHADVYGGMTDIGRMIRDAWVFGATYWPDPDIAIKTDYSIVRNRSTFIQVPNSFNLGLGWWF